MNNHLHADYEWRRRLRLEREAGPCMRLPECAPARKPLPRRSRWQKFKDAVARWRR